MPLHVLGRAQLPPAFGATAPFGVGIEEQLFLVDPTSGRVASCADDLLTRLRTVSARIVGELCDGTIELRSTVSVTAPGAVADLAELRGAILADGEVALLGAGVHPETPFGEISHRRRPQYDHVRREARGLLGQSACCAVHIHVGLPDPETAITACNGMRKWIPLLQALSANSPFWHGRDSGLASTRAVRMHSVPRTGIPRAFADWADYTATVESLCRISGLPDQRSLWWDVRPHPRLGTLEVRCLDGQSSLADLRALATLVHCLVWHEALVPDGDAPSIEVLAEASFQAIRDGVNARLALDGGTPQPVAELARHATELASGYAARLGCGDELAHIERLTLEGNGAVRQRRAFRDGGMPGVLAAVARETAHTDAAATFQARAIGAAS
jgi:glutamate---cysteine ligase / carboxylate-amine ligase